MKEQEKISVQDLALYLGCKAFHQVLGEKTISIAWLNDIIHYCGEDVDFELELIKPILRPLSDITEEEIKQMEYFAPDGSLGYSAQGYKFLISKHFDVFGWIEKGLAIDSTTLNN
jgi:hypothetical protein